jgi:hypothetical protein
MFSFYACIARGKQALFPKKIVPLVYSQLLPCSIIS